MIGITFFILLALAAAIVLQIFLAKKDNRWLGLILPIISLIGITIFVVQNLLIHYTTIFSTTVNGEVVLQTGAEMSSTAAIVGTAVYVFLLYNLPTALLLAIYLVCKNKRKKQHALAKMSIQDL